MSKGLVKVLLEVRAVCQAGIGANACVSGRQFDVMVGGRLQLRNQSPHQGDRGW